MSALQHAEQEVAGAEHASKFCECLEKLRDLEAKVSSAHEETAQICSEISTTREQFIQEQAQLRETQEEIRRIGTEFRAMREGVERNQAESFQKQEGIQEQLQRLATASAESLAAQTLSGHDDQLAQIIEATRKQQAAWEQDRTKLEVELEAERQRNAEQDKTLAEQRRLAEQQQAELAGELKRMRSLLEILSNHMNQPLAAGTADGNQATPSSESSALESMLAQFEMLQRDLAQRRAGGNKDKAVR